MELGLLGAFLGGVLTLLSPCSVMLLPAFFSYAFTGPSTLLARTGVFYLGLITTLVPLGVLAGSLGAFVTQHRSLVVTIAAWIVIGLGAAMLSGAPLPALARDHGATGTSTASVYALGTVYGLAGVCAGPLLGAALTMAALGGNAVRGGIILFVFGAGMVLPLVLLALAWNRLPVVQRLVRPRQIVIGRWRSTWTTVIGGLLTVLVGALLLVTDGTASLGGILGASDQAQLESWVLTRTSTIPDIVVMAIAGAVLLGVWGLARSRHARTQNPKQTVPGTSDHR